ncbi:MAG: DUF29 domain-containing protein [Microcystis sp. M048S1]|uniref:DUF29 domain-containing protein n=1 Tax=Microcystis viridis NIES-102 TaxID=213615 RepID=A0A3G9K2S3_MICVR|nr:MULTISPECIES: DUF29 domain-containing protein [Microcystis]MCA2901955.1 DUF29 domain-containing protein [Microcystis sp. M035S1]MCA2722646.1 DUF29 domain-containing protein [Microcystis sp. M176S2]MCA2726217.1 DUF29 domain-containing protein [Microcystis sp. M166S2]MCA2729722.1 DUF29 domain-containing protein [Microcystis sp. M162S2]MCA2746873.1 DUF29 domain-containing protein [Microcystis sp. M155S2]
MTASYEQDFGLWAEQMADLLASGRFSELDIENLVEEVRDLSKRECDRLLASLRLILHHLLKWDYQPQRRSKGWLGTIQRERANIRLYLDDSPSLKRYLTDESLFKLYAVACCDAFRETGLEFPPICPYGIEDILNRSLHLSER